MNRAITPKEAIGLKQRQIPDGVYDAFNELISRNISEGHSTFHQDEVIELIMKKMDCGRDVVFNNRWLDIEEIYRKAGWEVEYDKPGYNENYPANFVFKWT